jgi:hypothetical protein
MFKIYGLRVKAFTYADEFRERTRLAYGEEAETGAVISLFPASGMEVDPPTRGCVARFRLSLNARHEILKKSIYLYLRMSLISVDELREALTSTLARLKPESRRVMETLLEFLPQLLPVGQCEEADLSCAHLYESEREYEEAIGDSADAQALRERLASVLLNERRRMDGAFDN